MASIEELKRLIDLEDLARRVGLERPQPRGNWRSPHRADEKPSVSIFKGKDGTWAFKDHADDEHAQGTVIDFVLWAVPGECPDVAAAVRYLNRLYGLERSSPQAPPRERSRAEFIAEKCRAQAADAVGYLAGERGVPEPLAAAAVEAGAVGWNTWTNPKAAPGEVGYGGPAVAFIVRSLNPGRVVGVDMRFVDPALNGGVKTQTQGEKAGHPWYTDLHRLQAARTVYVVESPINALSVEACGLAGAAAVAVRGVKALDAIDWGFFAGKQLVLAFDNDEPDKRGRCAGQEAAWRLYDLLVAKGVSAMLVDQADWEWNDVNDILRAIGAEELKYRLQRLQPWAIPGLPGKAEQLRGRARLWLPAHDYGQYWRYRVKHDFTTCVSKVDQDPESGEEKLSFQDLAGFRVASLARVRIASAASVLSGDEDLAPRQMFAVTVQAPRHGAHLQRRVFEDDELHNVDQWKKFGPVFSPSAFARLVSVLERSADLGARDALNFVGVGWLDGRLTVNEGPDCYFADPDQQCPYSRLRFPSTQATRAAAVIAAYARTFRDSAALMTLVWVLGGHLKAVLGFWPHMVLQAPKGAGKSTLAKRLERTLGITVFGHESMGTQFRVLTTVSHTSHAVGWEEISAGRQEIIDQAVTTLQQSYQFAVTRRGAKMLEFVLSAPVLLAGEDVPIRSLEGKALRVDLADRKGEPLPGDLSVFPVRQWLEFLTGIRRERLLELHAEALVTCRGRSRARQDDSIAERMVGNYAALLAAWRLVCEFAEVDAAAYTLEDDLLAAMNAHIVETDADREPWVWILEVLLSEIDSNRYRHPYQWDSYLEVPALFVRHTDIINHLRTNTHLRDIWNGLPVKSARVLKQQLVRAGVVLTEDGDKIIGERRVGRMLALSLPRLEAYGLMTAPVTPAEPPPY